MGKFDPVLFDNEAIAHVSKIRTAAERLDLLIGSMLPTRAQRIARRKLEEAFMWSVKAAGREQLLRERGGKAAS